MGGNRVSKNVKCPFYHKHDGGKIKCEGLSDDSSIHLVFATPAERAKYMQSYCYSITVCKYCLIHNALDIKWGVDDE